jgi:hypothetical protein
MSSTSTTSAVSRSVTTASIRSATYCAPWPLSLMDTPPSYLCARLGMQQHTAQTSSDPIGSHAIHCTTGTSTGTGPALARHWPGTAQGLCAGLPRQRCGRVSCAESRQHKRRQARSAAVPSTHPCGRCPHGSRVRTVHMHYTRTLMHTGASVCVDEMPKHQYY